MREFLYQTKETRNGLTDLQRALGAILKLEDVTAFEELKSSRGDTEVIIDDRRGRYPMRRHQVSELHAEVGQSLHRVYFKDNPYDAHHPGRQFTLRPGNLTDIIELEPSYAHENDLRYTHE